MLVVRFFWGIQKSNQQKFPMKKQDVCSNFQRIPDSCLFNDELGQLTDIPNSMMGRHGSKRIVVDRQILVVANPVETC